MKPRLSIIVPTYNRAAMLRECLGSILVQGFREFRVIVVDDGSTDHTVDVVGDFGDRRVEYVAAEHRGEYAAVNAGLERVTSEYVTWVHDDDMLPEDSLARRIACLDTAASIDMVHGHFQRLDAAGVLGETIEAVDWSAMDAFSSYCEGAREGRMRYHIHFSTVMFRRSLLEKVGGLDEDLPYAGDIDWLLRALLSAHIAQVPRVLYLYRTHAGVRRMTDLAAGVDPGSVLRHIFSRYMDPEAIAFDISEGRGARKSAQST